MRFLRGGHLRLLPVAALFLLPSLAAADGGTIRLSEQKGNYRITVFTSPTVLRAGSVDISVLVQEAATGEPASGVQVTIQAVWHGSPGVALHHPATKEAATNKLYYAVLIDLPEPGWYSLEAAIHAPLEETKVPCELEAAEPLPPWLALCPAV